MNKQGFIIEQKKDDEDFQKGACKELNSYPR